MVLQGDITALVVDAIVNADKAAEIAINTVLSFIQNKTVLMKSSFVAFNNRTLNAIKLAYRKTRLMLKHRF